ncbi:hypothetical protein BDZ89DRAFT_1073337 [Hymenopellis radicata]|nr:hypothetical protein BDZ89DRAFT_1073337 [Hymenopellis radicata]
MRLAPRHLLLYQRNASLLQYTRTLERVDKRRTLLLSVSALDMHVRKMQHDR